MKSIVGQGSPKASRPCATAIAGRLFAGWLGLLLFLASSHPAIAVDDEPALRLRIAWGGGGQQQWQGTIVLSEGTFDRLSPLGLEPDEPGSIALDASGRTIRVAQPSTRAYDGIDVTVRAPLEATLSVALAAPEVPTQTVEVRLDRLVDDFSSTSLDDQDNRLLIRRTPGDRLRVRFRRDHLVFAPGERFTFDAVPHRTGIAPGSTVRFEARLFAARTDDELFAIERVLTVDSAGRLPAIEGLQIAIPEREGAYDVELTLTKKKPLRIGLPSKPAVRRRVQLVAVAPESTPAASNEPMQVVAEFDPAHPKTWEKLAGLPIIHRIPGFQQGPLGNRPRKDWQHKGRTLSRLDGGQWLAFPLPIAEPNKPHVLEVEYPGDVPQSLGISIIEPNAAGDVLPVGLDSGVEVPRPAPGVAVGMKWHRLVFWPRTKSPLVLLHNSRDESIAAFGRIRILAGPRRLPAQSRPAPDANPNDASSTRRLAVASLAQPLLPENFGAGEALDATTGRCQDDWATFFDGATRLTDYLHYVGYRGVSVSVFREGSTIYPSRLLEPTPKYDSGAFLTMGQDPRRKDVLELLYRLCDREQIALIPSLHFATPLPALERLLRAGGSDTDGIEPVNAQGRTWRQHHGTRQGLAPYYNPLDQRVQQAMRDVVEELAVRYGHHPSFAGIAIQMSADGYTQLPGVAWGIDDRTIDRFERETRVRLPDFGDGRFAQRAALLELTHREAWLRWRTERLAAFYGRLRAELDAAHPGATLYLNTAGLMDAEPVRQRLQPTLPQRNSIVQAMRELGVDVERLRREPGIVVPRPRRMAPMVSLASQAAVLTADAESEIDRTFGAGPSPGALFSHQPVKLRVPTFDAVSPFGPEKTYTLLVSHLSPSGSENRRRFVHGLATLDAQTMFDGGWMIPLGQEDALRRFLAVYQRLPAEPFLDAESVPPLTVRRLTHQGRTFVYVANDSPWPVTAEVHFVARSENPPMPLVDDDAGKGPNGGAIRRDGHWVWRVALEPFGLDARAVDQPDVEVSISAATLPPEVVPALRKRIAAVGVRAANLKNPTPWDKLANPSFEMPANKDGIPGWRVLRASRAEVRIVDAEHHTGGQALGVDNAGPMALVRSEPFEPASTGRLSVSVWLKILDAKRQPPLRLGIEGKLNGQTYYRHATIGAGRKAVPLQTRWAQYVFQVNDLPLEGLTGLQVCFDMMGPGRVWIDDVQLFDRAFTAQEQNELSKIIALADLKLGRREVGECYRMLDGYWPRFLEAYITPATPPIATRPAPRLPPAPPTEKTPGMFDRMRSLVPKVPWF